MMGLDIIPFIKSAGYVGIFVVILLENGIPLFFFLPGDTLLLTAGFLAAQGFLDVRILIAGGFVMAVAGYMLSYHLGRKLSARVFRKGDTRYIKMEHLEQTKKFYSKYGPISVFLARFLPLRACVSSIAGVSEMNYALFMFFNLLSAIFWAAILPLAGYFLGGVMSINDLKFFALLPLAGILGSFIMVAILVKMKKGNKDQETV